MAGFTPCPDETRTLEIRLLVNEQIGKTLGTMAGSYQAPWGTYSSSWKMSEDGSVEYTVTVPFGGTARLILPGAGEEILYTGTYKRTIEL